MAAVYLRTNCASASRRVHYRLEAGPVWCRIRSSGCRHLLLRQHVAELPRIAFVDLLRKESRAAGEWRPVRVGADDGTEIRHLYFQTSPEIHFVGFDDAGLR